MKTAYNKAVNSDAFFVRCAHCKCAGYGWRSAQDMKHTDQDSANLPEDVPQGFVLEPRDQGAFIIHHTRTGMGCMNVFLIVWLIGWTVGCVFLLRQYLGGGTMEDGGPIPLWFVLVFWGAEIGVAVTVHGKNQ